MSDPPTSVQTLARFLIAQGLEEARLEKENTTIVFRYGSPHADWMSVANLAFDYMWSKGANPTIANMKELDSGKLEHVFEFDQDTGLTKAVFTEIEGAVQELRGATPVAKAAKKARLPSSRGRTKARPRTIH